MAIITPGPFRFRYLLMVLAGIAAFVAISMVAPYFGAVVGIAVTITIFWSCIKGKGGNP